MSCGQHRPHFADGKVQCCKCEKTYPNHKWGRIRAWSAGWYIAWSETSYCPDHIPERIRKSRAASVPDAMQQPLMQRAKSVLSGREFP